MCEQCLTDAEDYGEPLPGWHLQRAVKNGMTWKAGEWGLIIQNGPEVTWRGELIEDPDLSEYSTEERKAQWEDALERFDRALHVHPISGYKLVKAAIKVGYDQNSIFSCWLLNHLAVWVNTYLPIARVLDG